MSLSFTASAGEKDIYTNFSPAFKNLYEISVFSDDKFSSDDKISSGWAKFHATSVKIDDEELSLQRNDALKQFHVDESTGYKWASTLSIKWREDSKWSVRQYHENWIGIIYDKKTDRFKSIDLSSSTSPYKYLKITLPDKMVIKCFGVLPKNIGNIDLAWGKQGGIIEPQLNYYISRVEVADSSVISGV